MELQINDRSPEFIGRIVDIGGGVLLADADELRKIGIRPVIDGRRGTGDIRLDRIDGITYEVDHRAQRLHIMAEDKALSPRVISAKPQQSDPATDEVHSGFGLVLNYHLAADFSRADGVGTSSTNASGSFDSRIFFPFGTLNHTFTLTHQPGDSPEYRRLDTFWRTPVPGRAAQL